MGYTYKKSFNIALKKGHLLEEKLKKKEIVYLQ